VEGREGGRREGRMGKKGKEGRKKERKEKAFADKMKAREFLSDRTAA
jgi:hypothetical protein